MKGVRTGGFGRFRRAVRFIAFHSYLDMQALCLSSRSAGLVSSVCPLVWSRSARLEQLGSGERAEEGQEGKGRIVYLGVSSAGDALTAKMGLDSRILYTRVGKGSIACARF
jgi:hypothetical protein